MCGRFVVASAGSELVGVLRVDLVGDDLPRPSFNVAPTDRVAIVLDSAKTDPPTRRLEAARWGLVPAWAKSPSLGVRAINARSEAAAHKPMFRRALDARRAVVPATGYYEWRNVDGTKMPYFIHPADRSPLLMAGLYEWWQDATRPDDDPARWLLSFTILTCSATDGLAAIHDRMPLFLDPGHVDAWLDVAADDVGDLLDAAVAAAPAVATGVEAYPVDRAVGNVRNDSPHLIDPVGA
ncbi:SOS response-associated peptidase [Microbacterium sp.]|uniref:SOS response-associated peptidase n=1 Tax=Microbacterium sp. TaxID=51671 RepID=UPI003A8BB434